MGYVLCRIKLQSKKTQETTVIEIPGTGATIHLRLISDPDIQPKKTYSLALSKK